MEIRDFDFYSSCLERNMHVKVYGHYGAPMIFFPCQNAESDCYEREGMISCLEDYIEEGKIKVYCLDSVDLEGMSDLEGEKEHRAWIMDQYFYYVINEFLPFLYEDCGDFIKPYVFGCSSGATHAAIMFFRRPDLFSGILGLSGFYDLPQLFDHWCNQTLYENCPPEFIRGMAYDHPYIELYNESKIILCGGEGRYDEDCTASLRYFEGILKEKGIDAWVDIWGQDVIHDWPWWFKMVRYHLPHLLED